MKLNTPNSMPPLRRVPQGPRYFPVSSHVARFTEGETITEISTAARVGRNHVEGQVREALTTAIEQLEQLRRAA